MMRRLIKSSGLWARTHSLTRHENSRAHINTHLHVAYSSILGLLAAEAYSLSKVLECIAPHVGLLPCLSSTLSLFHFPSSRVSRPVYLSSSSIQTRIAEQNSELFHRIDVRRRRSSYRERYESWQFALQRAPGNGRPSTTAFKDTLDAAVAIWSRETWREKKRGRRRVTSRVIILLNVMRMLIWAVISGWEMWFKYYKGYYDVRKLELELVSVPRHRVST